LQAVVAWAANKSRGGTSASLFAERTMNVRTG
jgi:hypothetical protein